MLYAQPERAFVGGVTLAFVAGQVNAVGVAGALHGTLRHGAITHVTGTVTQIAIDVAALDGAAAVFAASVVVAFIVGAAVSGAIVGSKELRAESRYGTGLVVESALLVGAWLLLRRGHNGGELLGALAAGLQNGLVTTWSGAIVRTSHVTGTATDIGVALGLRLRGVPLDRRIVLHLLLLFGFGAGGVVGALLWGSLSFDALALPASCCLVLALASLIKPAR